MYRVLPPIHQKNRPRSARRRLGTKWRDKPGRRSSRNDTTSAAPEIRRAERTTNVAEEQASILTHCAGQLPAADAFPVAQWLRCPRLDANYSNGLVRDFHPTSNTCSRVRYSVSAVIISPPCGPVNPVSGRKNVYFPRGSVTIKRVERLSLSQRMVPPFSVTMDRAMERPRPKPSVPDRALSAR